MEERKDVTVPMPQSMVEEIAKELDYGDSRAEWIRDAIQEKLEREREGTDAEGNPSPATA